MCPHPSLIFCTLLPLLGTLATTATPCFLSKPAIANIVGYQNKTVTAGDRAMRSAATFLKVGENPTAVKISDIKQTVGDPGDLTLCLYNDNVTRLAQYWYFSSEATGGELPEGWYILDEKAVAQSTLLLARWIPSSVNSRLLPERAR